MIDSWTETDNAILDCLRSSGTMKLADLARRVGVSETEATTFLCLLAGQGKIRLALVELNEERHGGSSDDSGSLCDRAVPSHDIGMLPRVRARS
jgi:DNA-binding Lrp family transcriptional regulator